MKFPMCLVAQAVIGSHPAAKGLSLKGESKHGKRTVTTNRAPHLQPPSNPEAAGFAPNRVDQVTA